MTKFVSVPTEIEAIQYTQGSYAEVSEFCGSRPNGDGSRPSFREGNGFEQDPDICAQVYDYLHDTWVGVKLNQWIIRGTEGELYPCDPDVFAKKYFPALTTVVETGGLDISGIYRGTKDVLHAVREPAEEPKPVIELPIHMPGNNRNWETVAGVGTVNADGTVTIRFNEPSHAEELVKMAKNKVLLQLAFDYKMSLDKLAKINTKFQMEYHDESTLFKVRNALKNALVEQRLGETQEPDELISALQEAGILFREKK